MSAFNNYALISIVAARQTTVIVVWEHQRTVVFFYDATLLRDTLAAAL